MEVIAKKGSETNEQDLKWETDPFFHKYLYMWDSQKERVRLILEWGKQ